MKEQVKTITFPVFNDYPIVVVKTDSIKKSVNKRKKILNTTINDDSLYNGLIIEPENDSVHIFLTKESTLSTITHESYHAIRAMFRYIGAEHEEEMIAYHLGYLVGQITDGEWKRKMEFPLDFARRCIAPID